MTHLLTQPRRQPVSFFYSLYTGESLLLLLIFYIPFIALPLQYIIQRRLPGHPTPAQTKLEKHNFRRNIFIAAILPVIFITLFYKTGYMTVFTHTPRYLITLETIIIILFHDAYFYRTHRLMHLPRFYKRFHRVHHASIHPTLYTAFNFDLVDLAVNYSVLILRSLIMGALFGGVDLIPILILMTYATVRNFYGHCGAELYGKKFPQTRLGKMIMTTTYHEIHHSKNNGNYTFFFTFRDRICGTVSPTYREKYEE